MSPYSSISFQQKKESMLFRALAASFDEKIDFVLESIGITFCQIGGGPVPRAEECDGLFTTFAHGVFADPSAGHFSNS